MKRRTYNNVLKATKMIAAKGYNWNTANEIAMSCFDNMERDRLLGINQNAHDVEFYINKIIKHFA